MLIAHIFQEGKKRKDNTARAQTWEAKADQVDGNHQTQKECCRNLCLKKNKKSNKKFEWKTG